MTKIFKELFKDWKTYVMIIGTVMMVFADCHDCDYVSAVWVILTFALWCINYILQIDITEYRRICHRYEELNSEAQIIMNIQSETIKELNDKLDGQDSKDRADSGPREVSEESL